MLDYSSRSKHFKALANMVGTTFGQWAIFMLIEEVTMHATEGDGILSKEKIKYKISDYILTILKSYYSRLKPVGGSYAGAKKPATATTSTRTSTTSPQELVEDTTGDSDLQQLIKNIITDATLDERESQTVHQAAAYFKLILEKILEDPVYGLRRNANKFHSFQASNRDAFQILDDILLELHPLEILIVGPEVTMLQELSHSTTHAASLRIDDVTRWRTILHESFRSSTSTTDMPDSLLMDRRPHLQHLAYLTSSAFELRLKTRLNDGSTTFHALDSVTGEKKHTPTEKVRAMLAAAHLTAGPNGLLHLTKQFTILEVFSGPNQSAYHAIKQVCMNPDKLRVITVDINAQTNPTIVADVRRWNPSSALGGRVDFAWLSPPCPEYSVAKTTGFRDLQAADATAKAALRIIQQVRPRAWVVENPTGLLRRRPFMQELRSYLQPTTYCMFDDFKYRKETDIWTNIPCPLPHCRLTPCKHKATHGKHPQTAQRGRSRNGTPGNKVELLHRVPHGLVQRLFLFAYRTGDNQPAPFHPKTP